MDSSPPKVFDSTFVLFVANYLLDGLLTGVALYWGVAYEANPLAAEFTYRAVYASKLLGLASIVGAAWLAAKFHPPVVRRLRGLFRVALLVFAAVCVSNLAVLWNVVG